MALLRMNDSASNFDYSASAWNETHHYSLSGGRLVYRFEKSDATYSLDVEHGSFTLRPRWQTHRYFRAGLVLFAFPLFTLGVIYAKEHTIARLGAMLYVQLGMLAIGVVLLLRFRTIYRAHILRNSSGDEILIYRDPNNAERADEFLSRLQHAP
jgi:hypothetical protein